MNNCISAELPIKTVDICLNGITMSTDEYSLGYFSLSGSGNITSETVDGQTIRYEYDEQNRLTHYFDPIANITRIYTYDDRGNILDVKYCGYMTEEEYTAFVAEYGEDTIPSFLYTYGDSTWADLLTNYSGTNIAYDELGNPLNWVGGRGITLTWENGRQLKQYKQGAARQYDYTYNADGLRTGKTITQSGSVTKQTEYYIVNGQYIGEVSTVNGTQYVIAYVYDENGAPAGINVNGSAYYFAKNLQGDIVAIMSYTGNVIARYYYDAWGDLISITDGDGNAISSSTDIAKLNPFRYRGYMYDDETGFYYLRSRYYDPSIGRFLNADNVVASVGGEEQGYNPLAYCFNNPIMYSDSCGSWPTWNDVLDFFDKIHELVTKPVEARVGIGMGIGGKVNDNITAEFSRDLYIGTDDGKIVTGTVIVSEVSVLDSDLKIGDTYDHRVEEDGERVSSSGKPWHGPFDMINYPDVTHGNEISILCFAINSDNEFLITASASGHMIFGGHASASFNVSEFLVLWGETWEEFFE